MTLDEARELVASPLWQDVRDHFLEGNAFAVYPAGDLRRLDYLKCEKRLKVSHWCDATARLAEWKKVVDGREVRELKAKFPDVYPEVLRYEAYFAKCEDDDVRLRMVLKLKFPEVLEMIER